MSFLTTLPRDRYDPDAFAAFDPAAGDFTLGNARAMAWLCQLAYETADPKKVASIATDWSLTIPDDPDGGIISEQSRTIILPLVNTQLIAGRCGNAAFMCFAGTDPVSLANWLTDFDFGQNSEGIANGFLRATQVVLPRITALLQRELA